MRVIPMFLGAAIIATWVVAAGPPVPVVGVIDLPAPRSPVELAPLPPLPGETQPPAGPPRSTDDESVWAAYREALASYEAARDQAAAMVNLRRDAERAVRDAARARAKGDRAAASLTYSVESAVRRLRVFAVRTARQVRSSLGEEAAKLAGCTGPPCLAPILATVGGAYWVTLSVAPNSPNVRVVLYGGATDVGDREAPSAGPPPSLPVLAEADVPVGGTARYAIPEVFAPALAAERERAYAAARRAADGLDWPAALGWLGRSLAIDPDDGESLYLAGYAFFVIGDLRSAERRLRAALVQEARVGDAAHTLALIYLRQNRTASAAEYFARALEHGHDSFIAHLLLGRTLRQSDPAAALTHLRAAVALRERHGEANFLLGMLLIDGDDASAAAGYLDAAVRAGYRPGDAHYELGLLAARNEQWPQAKGHLEAARKLGRASGEALYILGRLYVDKDPLAAVAALSEARRKGAAASDLDYLLGKAAVAAKDRVTAPAALGRAIAAGSHVADAHLLLAASFLEQGNTPEAASHYGSAAELGRDSYVARLCIGDAARGRGDWESALSSYRAALAQRSGDGPASFGVAGALIHLGRGAEAAPYLEGAVAAGHEVAQAEAELGRAAVAADDTATGQRHFAAAAAAGSVEPDVYRALARAAGAAGDGSAAGASWSRVLDLVPGDAEASYELGVLRIGAGRNDDAVALLEHVAGSIEYRSRAHRLLGGLAIDADAPQVALSHFLEAMKVADGSGSADFDLLVSAGEAAVAAGRDDLAKQFLARALACRPGEARLAYLLGELQIRGRRYAEARAFLRIALAAGYRAGHVHALLGQAAAGLGEGEAAREHFAAALAAGVDSAAGRLVLAVAASARGEKEVAVAHYAAAGRAALRENQPRIAAEALTAGRALDPHAAALRALAAQIDELAVP